MVSGKILGLIRYFGLTAQAKKTKRFLARNGLWPKGGIGYAHRNVAYKLLSGRGLEVGALHCPANVPANCKVEYCDAHTKEESIALFPEIDKHALVDVDYLVNLDEEKLSEKVKHPYDFVILNHVIEHVANPISVLEQLFAVVRPGGIVIISAPDKDFTFDKDRQITGFEHLLEEYKQGVTYVDDGHYLDFIRHTAPEIFNSGDQALIANTLASVRSRREHAHVWDSTAFSDFLNRSIDYLKLNTKTECMIEGKDTNLECFAVIRKLQ
jgi:SAM-dependent methyltransferase